MAKDRMEVLWSCVRFINDLANFGGPDQATQNPHKKFIDTIIKEATIVNKRKDTKIETLEQEILDLKDQVDLIRTKNNKTQKRQRKF